MAELPYEIYIDSYGFEYNKRYFGQHMSTHGDHMAVSVTFTSAPFGGVWLYKRGSNGVYSPLIYIENPSGGNYQFGRRTAIYENSATDVLIAITEPYFPTAGGSYGYVGKLYIYRWNGSNVTLEDTFIPTLDGVSQDLPYGSLGLACHGDFIAVGDTGQGVPTYPTRNGIGIVYFYEKSGGVWGAAGTFYPTGFAKYICYEFGSSIDIDESNPNYILVGSPQDYKTDLAEEHSGAAYVIERTGGSTYVQRDRLLPSQWSPYHENRRYRFGQSVKSDMANGRLVVGSFVNVYISSSHPGGVYVYDGSVGSWSETYFKPSDTNTSGQNVNISGDIIAFSDTRQSVQTYRDGCIYVFKLNGSWTQEYKLFPDETSGPQDDMHGGDNAIARAGAVTLPGETATYDGKLIGATSHPYSWWDGTDLSGAVFYYTYPRDVPSITVLIEEGYGSGYNTAYDGSNFISPYNGSISYNSRDGYDGYDFEITKENNLVLGRITLDVSLDGYQNLTGKFPVPFSYDVSRSSSISFRVYPS
jgi:hypothetical protein